MKKSRGYLNEQRRNGHTTNGHEHAIFMRPASFFSKPEELPLGTQIGFEEFEENVKDFHIYWDEPINEIWSKWIYPIVVRYLKFAKSLVHHAKMDVDFEIRSKQIKLDYFADWIENAFSLHTDDRHSDDRQKNQEYFKNVERYVNSALGPILGLVPMLEPGTVKLEFLDHSVPYYWATPSITIKLYSETQFVLS